MCIRDRSETESKPRPRRRSTLPAQDQLKAKVIGILQATKHTGATVTELVNTLGAIDKNERDRVRVAIRRMCVVEERIKRLHHTSSGQFTYYALEFAPESAKHI